MRVIKKSSKSISSIIPFIAAFTTLMVTPWNNFDPINLIKLIILVVGAFTILGLLISRNEYILELKRLKKVLALSSLFLIGLFIPFFFSGSPKSQQFWGTFGRNTGLLTYFALLIVMVSSTLIVKIGNVNRLSNIFISVGIFETFYATLQFAKLDPIKWSQQDIFGTLGNANFLSTFLGLASIQLIASLFFQKKSLIELALKIILVLWNLFIIYRSGSIQGILVFIIGAVVFFYYFVSIKLQNKVFTNILRVSIPCIALMGALALFNIGPLAKFLFGPTLIYRGDYIHAGWVMTYKNILTGVGLDSYGDWYRHYRGVVSTLRTGPDRTSNTAHNIFLDLSSNGGLFLIVAFLAILFFTYKNFKLKTKNSAVWNPAIIGIYSAWVAYLAQSLISINQIGVGIWFWIWTGLLLGNQVLEEDKVKIKGKRISNSVRYSQFSGLLVFFFATLGFILAFIPFSADAEFRSARNSGSLERLIDLNERPGISAFHLNQVVDLLYKNGYVEQATKVNTVLLEKFPRDYFGWRFNYLTSERGSINFENAKKVLQALDPENPEFK